MGLKKQQQQKTTTDMFTTTQTIVSKDIPSSRGRPTQMLTGITKIKLPPCTEEDQEIVDRSSLERCKTGKEYPSRTPASTARSTARSSRRSESSSRQATGRSTTRESEDSDIKMLTKEKHFLEDQLWDVSHKADWLKAQSGLRTTLLTKGASPDRWLNNGAKMYMANRYKTTSMSDYVGYHGDEVFAEQVTDVSNRRIKGQAAKYGNRLSGAKITLRGNF